MATKKTVSKVQDSKIAWRYADLAKPLSYREADTQYVGEENRFPDFEEQDTWSKSEYTTRLMKALNWYAYTQDSKKAVEWLYQFLARNPRRVKLAEAIKRGDVWPGTTSGFAFRAARVGLKLRFGSLRTIVKQLRAAEVSAAKEAKDNPKVAVVEEVKPKGPNIQDRLNEKMSECLGESEGRFDDFVTTEEFKGEPKLVDLLAQFNIQPAQLKTMQTLIEKRIAEFTDLQSTKDSQMLEAYKHLGKRQVTAIIKWWTQALADTNSYGIVKKAAKAPRKKKAVLPEKVVSKLVFLKEFPGLKLKSIDPVQILSAEDLWVYNTKTRKLGVYIADSHQQRLSVKGKTIFGFDAATSVQKTLRKPEAQLKELNANGKPAAKKWFKGVKSTEIKLNGRISADIVLLKAYK
jgi:hypothetical protein